MQTRRLLSITVFNVSYPFAYLMVDSLSLNIIVNLFVVSSNNVGINSTHLNKVIQYSHR